MVVFCCVADNMGTMFNKRRLSTDRKVREDMLNDTGSEKLCVSEYTYGQFDENERDRLCIKKEKDHLDAENIFLFKEDGNFSRFEEKIEKLIIYKWNRSYPADTFLNTDLKNGSWILESTCDFKGFSHDKITKEVYKKIK